MATGKFRSLKYPGPTPTTESGYSALLLSFIQTRFGVKLPISRSAYLSLLQRQWIVLADSNDGGSVADPISESPSVRSIFREVIRYHAPNPISNIGTAVGVSVAVIGSVSGPSVAR